MKEQIHFCTVTDRFVYSPELAIEMTYEFLGTQGWRCDARIMSQGFANEALVYTGYTTDTNDISTLMRIHRAAVETVLLALASLVALKGQSNE